MNTKGSVSVCIPVFNGAAHLRECLESVAAQDGVELEVVLRDDGSQDGSLAIAREVAEKHPRLRWNIEKNPANLGMVGNWNACLRAAGGELVKMMGQDDILLPGCLHKQARALWQNPSAALCVSAAVLLSAKGRRIFIKRRKWAEGLHGRETLLGDCARRAYNPLGEPVTGLARREAMLADGGYDETLQYWVDVDMWFQVLRFGAAYFLREPLCGFRIHRRAASFSLQGDSYGEFRRVIGRHAPDAMPGRRRIILQKLWAACDSLARLLVYRAFG